MSRARVCRPDATGSFAAGGIEKIVCIMPTDFHAASSQDVCVDAFFAGCFMQAG